MKIVGSQVILYVKDISESRNFYEKTLELPITYDGGEYWVTFDLGGTTLAIHPGGTGQDSADRTGISIKLNLHTRSLTSVAHNLARFLVRILALFLR
jgi:extradiol dioxygenase family protein